MLRLLNVLFLIFVSFSAFADDKLALTQSQDCDESGRITLVAADRSALAGLEGVVQLDGKTLFVDSELVEVTPRSNDTVEIRKKKKKSIDSDDRATIGVAMCDSCGAGGCAMYSSGNRKWCEGECCQMVVKILDSPEFL